MEATTILEYSSLETDSAVSVCDDGHIKATRNNTWTSLRIIPSNTSSPAAAAGGGSESEGLLTDGNWLYIEFTDVLSDWNFSCGPANSTAAAAAVGSVDSGSSSGDVDQAQCPAGTIYQQGKKIIYTRGVQYFL